MTRFLVPLVALLVGCATLFAEDDPTPELVVQYGVLRLIEDTEVTAEDVLRVADEVEEAAAASGAFTAADLSAAVPLDGLRPSTRLLALRLVRHLEAEFNSRIANPETVPIESLRVLLGWVRSAAELAR